MENPNSIILPDYIVKRYTDQIYKIVRFNRNNIRTLKTKNDSLQYDHKLDNSISRTRKLILEVGLCNSWEYFCTLTLDPLKCDRYNLPSFIRSLTQFFRDQRKKGFEIKYLLVPELHPTSGAWHLHGFMSGLPSLSKFYDLLNSSKSIPYKLLYSDFEYWADYEKRFGFCSFGKIRSPVRSAFYISKYITKDKSNLVSTVGAKLYYCSQSLNRATTHVEVYGSSSVLNSYLQENYEFCSVGMTKVSDGLTWDFALEYGLCENLFDVDVPSDNLFDSLADINTFEQLSFEHVHDV